MFSNDLFVFQSDIRSQPSLGTGDSLLDNSSRLRPGSEMFTDNSSRFWPGSEMFGDNSSRFRPGSEMFRDNSSRLRSGSEMLQGNSSRLWSGSEMFGDNSSRFRPGSEMFGDNSSRFRPGSEMFRDNSSWLRPGLEMSQDHSSRLRPRYETSRYDSSRLRPVSEMSKKDNSSRLCQGSEMSGLTGGGPQKRSRIVDLNSTVKKPPVKMGRPVKFLKGFPNLSKSKKLITGTSKPADLLPHTDKNCEFRSVSIDMEELIPLARRNPTKSWAIQRQIELCLLPDMENVSEYIDAVNINLFLVDYIARDPRNIGLYAIEAWSQGPEFLETYQKLEEFVLIDPINPASASTDVSLMVPIWVNGNHFVMGIFLKCSHTKNCCFYYADSMQSGLAENYKQAIRQVYCRVFQPKADLSPRTPLEFIDISSSSDVQIDSSNCAAYSAINLVIFADNHRTESHSLSKTGVSGLKKRLNFFEHNAEVFLRIHSANEDLHAYVQALLSEYTRRHSLPEISLNTKDEFRKTKVTSQKKVLKLSVRSPVSSPSVRTLKGSRPKNSKLAVLPSVIKNEFELAAYYIDLKTVFRIVRPLRSATLQFCDLPKLGENSDPINPTILTFYLFDYIAKDDRSIGLMEGIPWDLPKLSFSKTSFNKLISNTPRPSNSGVILLVPIFNGDQCDMCAMLKCEHYPLGVMFFATSTKAPLKANIRQYLNIVFNRSFAALAKLDRVDEPEFIDLSKHVDCQKSSSNSVAHTAMNFVSFLKNHKTGDHICTSSGMTEFAKRKALRNAVFEMFPQHVKEYSKRLSAYLYAQDKRNDKKPSGDNVHDISVSLSQNLTVTDSDSISNHSGEESDCPDAYEEIADVLPPLEYETMTPQGVVVDTTQFEGVTTRRGSLLPVSTIENKKANQKRGRVPLYRRAFKSVDYRGNSNDISPGTFNHRCPACKHSKFSTETSLKCCNYGKIVIPPFRQYPEWLMFVIHNKDLPGTSAQKKFNKTFKKALPSLNALLAPCPVTLHKAEAPYKGKPVPIINGNYTFNLCNVRLNPNVNEVRFAQIYGIPENEVEKHLTRLLLESPGYEEDWQTEMFKSHFKKLIVMMKKDNPICRGHVMTFDEIRKRLANGEAIPRYSLTIVNEKKVPAEYRRPDLHAGEKNIPTLSRPYGLIRMSHTGDLFDSKVDGLTILSTQRKPTVINGTYPICQVAAFPLLSPFGECFLKYDWPLQEVDDESQQKPRTLQQQLLEPDEMVYPEIDLQDGETNNLGFIPFGVVAEEEFVEEEGEELARDDERFTLMERCGKLPKRHRTHASFREQLRYHFGRRSDNVFNRFFNTGALGLNFIIHSDFFIEQSEINYYNQKVRETKTRTVNRSSFFAKLEKLIAKKYTGKMLGKVTALPLHNRHNKRASMLALRKHALLIRRFGTPRFFITLTANPNWVELKNTVYLYCTTVEESPDLMNRVFIERLKKIMRMLTGDAQQGEGIFGKAIAFHTRIEFQKRGNPHAHIALYIDDDQDPLTVDFVDETIDAELPDKDKDSWLYDFVIEHQLHICNDEYCRTEPGGKCRHSFPKKFQKETKIEEHIVHYRRRAPEDGGKTAFIKPKHHKEKMLITNQHIVAYNPYVASIWNGHHNVEILKKSVAIYFEKYMTKDNQIAFLEFMRQSDLTAINEFASVKGDEVHLDQARFYLSATYEAPQEAHWNIMKYPTRMWSHVFLFVGVHLDGDTEIIVEEDETAEKIAARIRGKPARSKFTAFMAYCNAHPEETKDLTFTDFVERYIYEKETIEWRLPEGRRPPLLAGLYEVAPKRTELYALRSIILVKKCPKSYNDIKTVRFTDGNGNEQVYVCDTFVEAAQRMGLCESDAMWEMAIQQCIGKHPRQIIWAFVQVLIVSGPTLENPRGLFEKYLEHMLPAVPRSMLNLEESRVRKWRVSVVLRILEQMLKENKMTLRQFNLEEPSADVEPYDPAIHSHGSTDFINDDLRREIDAQAPVSLAEDQKAAYGKVWKALYEASREKYVANPRVFFLQGPAGTGKTSAVKYLLHRCLDRGIPTIVTATTGVAAQLYARGRTVHSMFNIPNNVYPGDLPTMSAESDQAQEIRNCGLLVIDEASQLKSIVYEWILNTIRNVRNPAHPSVTRRLVILMTGDLRQTLPIVRGESEVAAFQQCVIQLHSQFTMMSLYVNKRTRPGEAEFADYLLKLGVAADCLTTQALTYDTKLLKIHDRVKTTCNADELANFVFPAEAFSNSDNYCRNAIIAPHNDNVRRHNEQIMARLSGNEVVYTAVNTPEEGEIDETTMEVLMAQPEIMGRHEETGFPRQTLKLKVGAIVMMIRNLSVSHGLTNGTRLSSRN